jgi:ribosomal-protein-alanine N-acetyltransferase
VRSELDNPLSLWLVAEREGQVLGYIGSQSVLGEADMMNVAVTPEARRCGIARALIVTLIESLRANAVHCLTLEVRASNLGAQALYAKLNFREVGRRKNYYSNPKEDALILRTDWGNDDEYSGG